jgi:hypothetical protein
MRTWYWRRKSSSRGARSACGIGRAAVADGHKDDRADQRRHQQRPDDERGEQGAAVAQRLA